MKIDWTPLRAVLENSRHVLITSHIRPDADAIGSELGLACILESLGKTVAIVNVSPTPAHLAFLDPQGKIRQLGVTATADEVLAADVQIIVDTSAWGQLQDIGKLFKESTKPRVVIDHHISSDDLGAIDLKDTSREATGSLIHELASEWGVALTESAAIALFAAVATDTGWFRFPATTSDTFRVGSELVASGATPHVVYKQLYEQGTLARIRLHGRVMSRVTLDCEGKLAYTFVRWADFEELGASAADTEDLVNEGLTITGTKAALIAIEQPNRQVKISFRGRDDVNVAAIAEQFGGGGHRLAAGATLPGPFDEALSRALEAMRRGLTPVTEA